MLYNLVRLLLTPLFLIVFRWKVTGVDNIPTTGGAIIAANHVSFWDPPVVGTASPRRVHFMAKEELFKNPMFKWIITHMHAFPVRRGAADRTAIRTALNLLKTGSVVGIFPEGTRSKNGQLGTPEPGLAMLALKAGVPVIPTAIIGTNKVFCDGHFLPQFRVKYGKPIVLTKDKTSQDTLDTMSASIMTEITRLLEEDQICNCQKIC